MLFKLNVKGLISIFLIILAWILFLHNYEKATLKRKMAAWQRRNVVDTKGCKLKIPTMNQEISLAPWCGIWRTHHLWSIPASNHEEADKPKLKDILQNLPVLFKNGKVMKNKEWLRTKETWQLNLTHWSGIWGQGRPIWRTLQLLKCKHESLNRLDCLKATFPECDN